MSDLPHFYSRFTLSEPQKSLLRTLLDSSDEVAVFESKYFATAQALYRKGAVASISQTVGGKFQVHLHRPGSADTEAGPTWPARFG
jgi:hypothetical protein